MENEEIKVEIAEIKKDICWIKDRVSNIEHQIFNEIPHSIKKIEDNLEVFKLSNFKWLISILITLLFTLLGVILKIFNK